MPAFPEQLFYTMKAADEYNADEPDGAWWAILEDTARWYMKENNVKGKPFDAVHAYISWKAKEK